MISLDISPWVLCQSFTLTIRTSDPGWRAVDSNKGRRVRVNKKGLIWLEINTELSKRWYSDYTIHNSLDDHAVWKTVSSLSIWTHDSKASHNEIQWEEASDKTQPTFRHYLLRHSDFVSLDMEDKLVKMLPRISNRSSLPKTHSAACFALVGSVKSNFSHTISPALGPRPSFSNRSMASFAFSSERAARYTLAPWRTRCRRMYNPIPELKTPSLWGQEKGLTARTLLP